jgi:hypothetical protein
LGGCLNSGIANLQTKLGGAKFERKSVQRLLFIFKNDALWNFDSQYARKPN